MKPALLALVFSIAFMGCASPRGAAGGSDTLRPQMDAKWTPFASYVQRLVDTVQIQWERVLLEGKIYPRSGSSVAVTFTLDSSGRVVRIVKVDNSSTDAAARACINGITDRAPYGAWTDEMRAALGEEQTLTLTFFYR
jgi:hypothetical protein